MGVFIFTIDSVETPFVLQMIYSRVLMRQHLLAIFILLSFSGTQPGVQSTWNWLQKCFCRYIRYFHAVTYWWATLQNRHKRQNHKHGFLQPLPLFSPDFYRKGKSEIISRYAWTHTHHKFNYSVIAPSPHCLPAFGCTKNSNPTHFEFYHLEHTKLLQLKISNLECIGRFLRLTTSG